MESGTIFNKSRFNKSRKQSLIPSLVRKWRLDYVLQSYMLARVEEQPSLLLFGCLDSLETEATVDHRLFLVQYDRLLPLQSLPFQLQ
mmetsp:Transcript_24900/g.37842  ORF Transcript_24900/g.37842 Transcript_24900/m.37842 type:complete len:87 (-) Transcript_24900:1087-1347(-)